MACGVDYCMSQPQARPQMLCCPYYCVCSAVKETAAARNNSQGWDRAVLYTSPTRLGKMGVCWRPIAALLLLVHAAQCASDLPTIDAEATGNDVCQTHSSGVSVRCLAALLQLLLALWCGLLRAVVVVLSHNEASSGMQPPSALVLTVLPATECKLSAAVQCGHTVATPIR